MLSIVRKRTFKYIGTGLTLAALSFAGTAHSSMMAEGTAVGSLTSKTKVGTTVDRTGADNAIEYYIPLGAGRAGTYAETNIAVASNECAVNEKAGTCSDRGRGDGYDGADSLTMNIYFDLSGLSNRDNATLEIWFEDLDLIPINDPAPWFFESFSFDAENDGNTLQVAPTKDNSVITEATVDPFTWSLDLSSLGTLEDDFWIQLGFGSFADLDPHKTATNTPEYLKATISTVPLPASFWLFGTALIGFVGMSRRTKIS